MEQNTVWRNLHGCSRALVLSRFAQSVPKPILVIAENPHEAEVLQTELHFFAKDIKCLLLPDWETLPYDLFSPSPEVVSKRLKILAQLPQIKRGIVITPLVATLRRLAPPSWIQAQTFSFRRGDRFDRDAFCETLVQVGYRRVEEVQAPGEFATRGAIFDLFPMGSSKPVRIELFDDEIETLRHFDPETQRSQEKIETFELLPAREFPTDEKARKRFLQRFAETFPQSVGGEIETKIRSGDFPSGIEAYLPLWLEETLSLFDYLPEKACLVLDVSLKQVEKHFDEIKNRYEQRRHDRERPLLLPETLFLPPDEWQQAVASFENIYLREPLAEACRVITFPTESLPEIALRPQKKNPAEALHRFLKEECREVLFLAESPGRKQVLQETLRRHGIDLTEVENGQTFVATEPKVGLAVAPIGQGFYCRGGGEPPFERPFALIPETALWGEKARTRHPRERKAPDLQQLIADFQSLQIGAPVVHRDHGVGRYRGLQHMSLGGVEGEFLVIEYQGGDLLYVPVTDLHLVGRYQGVEEESAPWHKLGSDQWQKAKQRAERRARDVAAELLDLYARRASKRGHAFSFDEEAYRRFADAFLFEETPDQEAAIQAVLEDLQKAQPMDRIVCGDVGFGKTEIALRAAFVAAMAGRQVAVLVPTTLLAQQHYQTFLDRFADWPIRIETLSRFVPAKRQRAILEDLAAGKVDIVIGTHKLLQKSVKFKDLGLVIIDEEHRFGVRQKEHLKKLRAEVDVLSLTATPIPRTLHMALSSLRDISIIASPPEGRLPIKTFISEWNDTLVQEAILREIRRGGQVYFVHNKIESLERVKEEIERLVPEARVQIAHGQMAERELERIMLDFYHHRFDVLLCTTIIESGIDIPNANTIIIDRADRFGLAQLHQLRGRVGRSDRQAYAYLLVPPKSLMTREAERRLEALEKASDLGAGFVLSSYDLEIRGAGELLGEAQSGRFEEVGLDLFLEMLQRAVKALKEGEEPELASLDHPIEIHLKVPTLLPEDYIPDVHTRLKFYKQIAIAQSEERLEALAEELRDRFGPLPRQAEFLFETARLRLFAAQLGIQKIEAGEQGGQILFEETPKIDVEALFQLLQEQPETFQMAGPNKLRFRGDFSDSKERISWLRELLGKLSPSKRAVSTV